MKRIKNLALVTALLLPLMAMANSSALSAMKKNNQTLENLADACMYTGRTAFVQLRAKENTNGIEQELNQCVIDGKEAAKEAHSEIKAIFKKKKLPTELAEWRLEWMAAFDATALKPGENEAQYLRRIQEGRSKVERATNKFEISTE